SIPLMVAPAPAWEFSMDGVFTSEFEYRYQAGREGFFGPYDVDAGSGAPAFPGLTLTTVRNTALQPIQILTAAVAAPAVGQLAPLNLWLGFHQPGNDQNLRTRGSSFASGSEGSWNTIYMNTNMQIRMNQALRIRGNYYVGEWYTPGNQMSQADMVASELITYASPGIQRSFSPGYWRTLWLTAELPWGIVAFGKRASSWGTGFQWNGTENRSSESLALSVPYGPFLAQVSFYPSRRGTTDGTYYNQDYDKNNARYFDVVAPSVVYRSGPLDTGFLLNFVRRHNGGEARLLAGGNGVGARGSAANALTYIDFEEFYGGVYVNYSDGRVFFASEVDWDHTATYRRGGGPTYREHWRFMANTGVFSGPAKASLLYAWLTGPDRRGGVQIDRTGLNADVGIRSNSFTNTGFFRPYSYLMVYSYGFGTHMNADTRNGTAEDASIWAARFDYAVASNLNVYGTFFWADRQNNSGYGWGFIRPDAGSATEPVYLGYVRWGDRAGAPNIPDPNLGYELGAGMNWQLLEGLTVSLSCAYWQPGKWFSYACVDKAIPLWSTAAAGPYGWGVYPDRNISPVWGLELKVNGEF
ncbi:MAG: hypothetical protein WCG29_03075, partial [Desulfomonile sp.]